MATIASSHRRSDPSELEPSWLTLRFPGRWEAAFYDDYFDNSLLLMRLACLSMAAVALLYGLAMRSMLVRFVGLGAVEVGLVVLVAALLGAFGLTFTRSFRRVMRPVLSVLSLSFVAVFVATLLAVRGTAELLAAVLVALVVGALCAFHLLRVGFVHALAVTALGTGLWTVAALSTSLASPTLALMVVDVQLLVAITGYVAERYIRRDFAKAHLLAEEQERSERLLLNVLPAPVAERLKAGEEPLADDVPEATVLFADLVGFTAMSAEIAPRDVVRLLNELFSDLDRLEVRYGLEKVKTIGDAYMAVAGIPAPRGDHAEAAADMALEMLRALRGRTAPTGDPLRVRIGISSGPLVAGVIGLTKFAYDLWGDTVNTASRMEATGVPDGIQVSEATYLRLKGRYDFGPSREIDVKGKGRQVTYLLLGR